MAFSVEIQVRAKNTYARLVCSLSEIGALFSTGSFVKAAVLDLAMFDASALCVGGCSFCPVEFLKGF